MRQFIVSATFLAASHLAFAQMPVHISAQTSDDLVGNRMVFALKEKIRRSAGMSLVDKEGSGVLTLRITTLDPDRKNKDSGNQTIYSVAWTVESFHNPPMTIYLNSNVGLCGANRVQECADDFAADADKRATIIKKLLEKE